MKDNLKLVGGWVVLIGIFAVIFGFMDNPVGHYILGGIVLGFVITWEIRSRISKRHEKPRVYPKMHDLDGYDI